MSDATGSPALSLRGINKTYPNGTQALRGVDLDVARSEVVAIIGPSGCGKSTLLRTINGLEPIDAGEIRLGGKVLDAKTTNWQQVRQRVGMVFQSYELFSHLTVMKNLLLAPRVVNKEKPDEVRSRALALLARVGLAEREDSLPRELSGGQKQRVAIVRALLMNPEVMLLDEITASLDPETVREVLDVVLELAAEGMTMVLVTHELAFARAIADRVVFMHAGRIEEIAPPDKFFTQPQTQRARRFLDAFEFPRVNSKK